MTEQTTVADVYPIPLEDMALYNSLSNIQIARIIDMAAHHNRLDVYIGSQNRHCLGSPVTGAFMNGAMIQVNLESSELENLSDDPFWTKAFSDPSRPDEEAGHA